MAKTPATRNQRRIRSRRVHRRWMRGTQAVMTTLTRLEFGSVNLLMISNVAKSLGKRLGPQLIVTGVAKAYVQSA